MNRKIIHFETLGCRLNHDESEGASRVFTLKGFLVEQDTVSSLSKEDENVVLSIINTCTVTAKAEQKARRLIKLMLKQYPNSPVIVTGCYAQLDASSISQISPDRIVILDGKKKFKLAEIAERLGTDSDALRVYEYTIAVDYDLAAGDIKRSRSISDDEFNNVVAEYTSDDILEKMSSICTDIQNDTGNESAYIIAYFYYTDPGCSVFCINYFADGSYRFSDLR